jgi:Amt family ammonium transporter
MVRNAMYGLLASAVLPVLAQAQATTPATIEEKLAKLEAAAAAAQTSGDNAWMLTSSALVLMMTGPGLALFYGGLVRRKNVLSTMMHSFILMAVMTVLWAVIGYSISFGEGTPYFGSLQYLMLNGVGTAPSEYLATVPHLTYPGADFRRLRRTCSFLGDVVVHRALGFDCVLPHGTHGLG